MLLPEEQERIAETKERVGGGAREPDTDMEIDLVARRKFVGSTEVKKLARPSAFREIAGILDKSVPRFGQLPVEVKGGFAREIVSTSQRGPVKRGLATECPVRGKCA